MLQNVPADNYVEGLIRKRVRLQVTSDAHVQRLVALELARRYVDSGDSRRRSKVEVTRGSATSFQHIDLGPRPVEERTGDRSIQTRAERLPPRAHLLRPSVEVDGIL